VIKAPLCVLAVALAILLCACGNSPSQSACKSALRAEYVRALHTNVSGPEPAVCKGLPASVVNKLETEVQQEGG
jgi:hypothetical protein